MKPKNEPEMTVKLELHDDDSPREKKLPLTPAEIAALEAEKVTLLREVRERAAHEPRIQSPAPSRQMPAAERESALAESLIRAQLRGQTPRAETQ